MSHKNVRLLRGGLNYISTISIQAQSMISSRPTNHDGLVGSLSSTRGFDPISSPSCLVVRLIIDKSKLVAQLGCWTTR
jgi:hypothetical protein